VTHRGPRLPLRRVVGVFAIVAPAVLGRPGCLRAEPVVALYNAYWAGLPAARIRLEFGADGAHYRDDITIDSDGLPQLVTRFRGTATAEGQLSPGEAAQPLRYDAVYDLRKRRNSHISMRFAARGGAFIAERGAGDTSRKPQLREAFRRFAVDPLSAFERLREALRAVRRVGRGSFTIPVYDGARRFDVQGRLLPKSGRDGQTLRVALTLHPIAGFKGETSEDGDPDDAPRPARLTLSDDARLLPLSIEVNIYFLPLVVRLDRLCDSSESCRK
jgi:hypothetical protein